MVHVPSHAEKQNWRPTLRVALQLGLDDFLNWLVETGVSKENTIISHEALVKRNTLEALQIYGQDGEEQSIEGGSDVMVQVPSHGEMMRLSPQINIKASWKVHNTGQT